jgi:hypothetical protein
VPLSDSLDLPSQLAGVAAKIDRANALLDEMKAEAHAFLAGPSYELRGSYDEATHAWEERLHILRQPPLKLGVIVGDYVHNLRSALDQLVWQLVLLAGAEPARRNQMPIEDTPDKFARNAKRMLNGVSAGHRATLERAQPYHAAAELLTEHPLRVLRELSNVDKHQVVHPAYSFLGDADPPTLSPQPPGPHGVKRILMARNARMEEGTVVIRVELHADEPPPTSVDVTGHITIDTAFGDQRVDARFLRELLVYVLRIVGSVMADFGPPVGAVVPTEVPT